MTSPGRAQALRRWAWPLFDGLYLLVMFVTATVRRGGTDFPGHSLVLLLLASWVPLLFRRRYPRAVLATVVLVEAVHVAFGVSIGPHPTPNEAMGAYQPVPLATLAAAFTLAARQPGRRGWAPGVLGGLVLLVAGLAAHGQVLIATSFVALDVVVMAVGAGVLVSVRRERLARDQRERLSEIRGEVIAERIRIAQDLHDVLAHHLTLVNAQAGVAEYLLRSDPEGASGALRDIAGNTRKALDELRSTVGLLREDQGPQDDLRPAPGLSQLDELLAAFRASAGTTIAVWTSGTPLPLSTGGDLSAYRIVQEAVTNATKHAPGAPVEVVLTWHPDHLDLKVANPAAAGRPPGHQGPGTRHGLIGMRERAATVGGTLEARPTRSGGFEVYATIPVPARTTSGEATR